MASFSSTVMFCWWLITFFVKFKMWFLMIKYIGWVSHSGFVMGEMSDF